MRNERKKNLWKAVVTALVVVGLVSIGQPGLIPAISTHANEVIDQW